jgi:hypothetical protein
MKSIFCAFNSFFFHVSLSDDDESDEGSSQLKVLSLSIQLFMEENLVLLYTFFFATVGWTF